MATVLHYLKAYGDYSFREMPMNEVDSLALCQLSYLKFDGMVPGVRENRPSVTLSSLAERDDFDKLFADVRYETVNRALFSGMLAGKRFRNLKINYYENVVEKEWETQFSAVTFLLEDGTVYVAYRGKFTFKDLKVEDGMRFKSYKKSILLVLAVTLHNIPEGLAVGVAFGGAALGIPGCTVASAILLAVGIGLQNFPEGAAVSLPLRREGFPVGNSFLYGQASGLVEPIAGVLGVFMAIAMRAVLPILLAFSAGAMVGVVSSELIPEACIENKNLTTVGVIIGFTLMMILDVALG